MIVRSGSRAARGILATVALTAVLAASGCTFISDAIVDSATGGGGGAGGFAASETELQVLYAAGDTGGVATQRISVGPSDDGELSIDISEDEVSGVGDMTQAASWNAVSVATLLTGAPLDVSYRFAFDGRIDGPSAGALTTIGILSLYYGDDIADDATMTGTINPMGTVGTVGGIPEKVQGVIDEGTISTVLIPAGQRNVPDAAGNLVDVGSLGRSGGVEVVEVADVYDAYPLLTGEELPRPADDAAPAIPDAAYTKFQSAGDAMLATYDRALAEFAALDPVVQQAAGTIPAEAAAYADRARQLQVQALQGGAFFEASQAAAVMQATASTFRTVQDLLTSGGNAIGARLDGAASAEGEFTAFLDQLSTYEPETLADAEALVTAYGNAFDAYTLLQYATASLQRIADTIAAAGYTDFEQLLTDALTPLIYYDLARGNLAFAQAVFDIGRDNGGTPIAEGADLDAIASFFRRAADADWAAFESGVIQPIAESRGESNDVFRTALSAVDTDVALSYTAQQSVASIEQYLGEGSNAPYAAMGYGYVNYARNAVLIEKYYNNGVLDDNLQVVGVSSETILTSALDLGRTQTARGAGILTAEGTSPVLIAGAYEQAGVAREGDVADKFQAIAQYSGAFVLSRILAYAGGFERSGYAAD
ncbi:S16 family serine protease [Microbacterium sp. CCNWLW134]|uniref:S16 family serine protease n=1 Tax=Microbacterium sp. CCNWLW134 TaxID=3122064 RepID=UPI0030101146